MTSRRHYTKGANRSGRSSSAVTTRVRIDDHLVIARPGLSSPADVLATTIRNALDPARVPSPVKRFAEMTDEEKAEMRRLYEKKGGTR